MSGPITLIHCGGTFGMEPGACGRLENQRPLAALLADYLPEMAALDLRYIDWQPLMDSSDLRPEHWNVLLAQCEQAASDSRAVIIIHGTDTLAYSAAALDIALPSLRVPVILTGAQRPLCAADSDAGNNLSLALRLADDASLAGQVVLAFAGEALAPRQVRKVRLHDLHAFAGGHRPLPRALPDYPAGWTREPFRAGLVGTCWWTPGLSSEVVDEACRRQQCALLLLMYGQGNGPGNDAVLLAALEQAIGEQGLVVVLHSQCPDPQGLDTESPYASGDRWQRAGCLRASGMSPEYAWVLLTWLASQGFRGQELADIFGASSRPAG